MKQIKYNVIVDEHNEYTIRTDDGGLAVIRHNGEMFLTDYYQSRTKEAEINWDGMSESKMYCKEWGQKDFIDEDMINDALSWLVTGDVYEFIRQDELLFKPCTKEAEKLLAKNNKLLAVFIGMIKSSVGWRDVDGALPSFVYQRNGGNIHDTLHFHESYNWLMPVIEIIENLGFTHERRNHHVFIQRNQRGAIITQQEPMEKGLTMMQETYNIAVRFVEYHNKLVNQKGS